MKQMIKTITSRFAHRKVYVNQNKFNHELAQTKEKITLWIESCELPHQLKTCRLVVTLIFQKYKDDVPHSILSAVADDLIALIAEAEKTIGANFFDLW